MVDEFDGIDAPDIDDDELEDEFTADEFFLADEDMTITQVLGEVQKSTSQDAIVQKYSKIGLQMLSDELPTRLDPQTQARMERILGADIGDVRIHVGPKAEAIAEAVGARAFTLGGSDIFFGKGQYALESKEGQALLAHELTHVVKHTHKAFAASDGSNSQEQEEVEARGAEDQVLAQDDDPPNGGDDAAQPGGGGGGGGGGGPEDDNKDDEYLGIRAADFEEAFWDFIMEMEDFEADRIGNNLPRC